VLQKQFPDAKIVPYTDFGINTPRPAGLPPGSSYGNSPTSAFTNDQLVKLMKDKKCDAVVLGNGG
jgi:hypothetical protein